MTYLSHQMDVYPVRLVIAHGSKQWKAAKKDIPELADEGIEDARSIAGALTTMVQHEDEMILAFWFPKKQPLGEDRRYSVIAHEAAHGAAMLFEHIQQEPSSDEPFAYLVEWLFVMIEQAIKP